MQKNEPRHPIADIQNELMKWIADKGMGYSSLQPFSHSYRWVVCCQPY